MDTARVFGELETKTLVALQVSRADAEVCAEKLLEIDRCLKKVDGFRGVDVIRRDDGVQVDFYILTRFRDPAALRAGETLSEMTSILTEVEAFALTNVSRQKAVGATIWFAPIGTVSIKPILPPLWKRWVTSLLAVYPALVVLVCGLKPLTKSLPETLGLFLVAAVLTGLTTAFIAPYLTRALYPWLTRR